jgi:hypothetical protein
MPTDGAQADLTAFLRALELAAERVERKSVILVEIGCTIPMLSCRRSVGWWCSGTAGALP